MGDSILVGVTETAASRRAVDWAAHRARERHDRIELISIIGGVIGTVGEGAVINEAIERTRAMLAREAERARVREVPVETRLGRGNPVEELINESVVFDLLVIGSDYRGPNSGTQRGPHGVRIVAGAHCPVAVVPDIDLTGRSGVIVGVDGSPTSERAIEFAAAEADRFGEELTAVTTWTTVPLPLDIRSYPMNYLSAMQKLTEETLAISLAGIMQQYPDLTVRRVVERGHPTSTIKRLAADARLAVVGSHGRGAVARFLLGSTSQAIVADPVTATVVVR